ncbi:MAG: hypothetical protein WAQ05_06170 [Rubrivivax sp.]
MHTKSASARAVATTLVLLAACADAGAQGATNSVVQTSACGPVAIPGHYGPFDYTTQHGRLQIVEQFHFTPKVEALLGGESGYLGADLTYTLNAAPNHHRALLAAMNYATRTNSETPPHMRMSVECYFDRAIRFRADDTVVRVLFAMYLARLKRMPEAERQLEAAVFYAADNGLSQNNIGLAYLEFGLYDKALQQAHRARKLGFEGTLLADRLKAVNQWKEPTE